MPKIYEMPPHLADLIAAGEVVERPASVVKELCENSIDAGAKSVTVEIQDGGMSFIRVTDNGCGMAPEDAKIAFLRHATSKLRDERGLEAIATLGFRGEALAAISAVSRVELLTKERDAATGTRVELEAGKILACEAAGCPDGTTMIVRNLFFNTPARLKYMKNDKAEGAAVTVAVTKLCLSHPEISIRYIKDGHEEIHTPGDGKTESAVYSVLGRDAAKSLLKTEGESGGVFVRGYVSTPAGARGNRGWQFFFINGRFVKSRVLQAALEQAYKNSLFTGRFPACVLEIDMSYSKVDVNVHPAKLEVRFSDERAVFDAVYWAVRGALETESAPAELTVSRSTASAVRSGLSDSAPAGNAKAASFSSKPREDFFKSVSSDEFRSGFGGGFKRAEAGGAEFRLNDVFPSKSREQGKIEMPPVKPVAAPDWTPDAPIAEEREERPWRFIGEALNTYLIVEKGTSVFLIDKHAAHERVLFDKLKEKGWRPEGQLLMTPVIVNVGEETAAVIAESAGLLGEYGFEIDDFGGGAAAIRQIPQDLDISEPEALIEELAGILSSGRKRELSELRDDIMHTVACKAAIKAGTRSEPASVTGLIDKVMSGEVRYCPHGRPVMMELTKYQLDKGFKRV
ncbi:MAG: DNA mismatch repair endonuclease MutL [Oscillospiraceae bacterium]|nr:DNA mismatch repair endonuclease MutL [Oscillospiraceae bacterium]